MSFKKLISRLVVLLFVLGTSLLFDAMPSISKTHGVGIKESKLKIHLSAQSRSKVKVHQNLGSRHPFFIQGSFSFGRHLLKESVAKEFLATHVGKTLSHQSLKIENLKIRKTLTDKLTSNTIVRTQQSVNGVPIFGSDIGVHISPDNEVKFMSGQVQDIAIGTTPKLTQSKALIFAKKDINLSTVQEMVTLEIYMKNGTPFLTWHCVLYTQYPEGEWHVFVDALSGDIVSKFNNITEGRNRMTYHAQYSQSLPGVLAMSETEETHTDSNIQTTHAHIKTTYDYFFNEHGRDSFDGNGATIVSSVHLGSNYVNAYWNGTQLAFGDGDGVTAGPLGNALDIVAHEFGHALTQYTAGLIYQNQSGALNESMSDIWGAMIDDGDWMIGEDVWTPNTPGDAFRYMDNPPLGTQPGHMADYKNIQDDNGGVHINSGIPNKACYLTAAVIGRTDTAKIYYRALTIYFTASTTFYEARVGLIQAAIDLFGINSAHHLAVVSAQDAVGIVNVEPPPPVDSTPPGSPRSVKLISRVGEIKLKWENPSDTDLSHIMIYEKTTNVFFNVGLNETFTHPDLKKGTVYKYQVFSKDQAGHTSSVVDVSGSPLTIKVNKIKVDSGVLNDSGQSTYSSTTPKLFVELNYPIDQSIVVTASCSLLNMKTNTIEWQDTKVLESTQFVEFDLGTNTGGFFSFGSTGLKSNTTYTVQVSVVDSLGNQTSYTSSPFLTGSSTLEVKDFMVGPNPYNPSSGSVRFQFSLTRPALVNIYGYSLAGRQLFNKQWNLSAGLSPDTVNWEGKNQLGNLVSNGMYILYLVADDGKTKVVKKTKLGVLR